MFAISSTVFSAVAVGARLGFKFVSLLCVRKEKKQNVKIAFCFDNDSPLPIQLSCFNVANVIGIACGEHHQICGYQLIAFDINQITNA